MLQEASSSALLGTFNASCASCVWAALQARALCASAPWATFATGIWKGCAIDIKPDARHRSQRAGRLRLPVCRSRC